MALRYRKISLLESALQCAFFVLLLACKALTDKQLRMAKTMLKDSNTTIMEVCQTMRVSKTTLYRYLNNE